MDYKVKEFLFDGNEAGFFGSGGQILNGVQRLGDSELSIEGCVLNGRADLYPTVMAIDLAAAQRKAAHLPPEKEGGAVGRVSPFGPGQPNCPITAEPDSQLTKMREKDKKRSTIFCKNLWKK